MTSSKHTIAMSARGQYSLHTQGAKDVIDNACELALQALAKTALSDGPAPYNIADYGAADGGTSVDLIGRLIDYIRERAPNRPVAVNYTDLPRNDYSALFLMLQDNDPTRYLRRHKNVFPLATATSFFDAIFPPESIDFGFSATAMHWLSALPCHVSNHIHAVGAQGNELERLRKQALQDWETILCHRGAELKPGGRLVLCNLAIDNEGRHMGNTGGVNLFNTLNDLWWQLVEAGAITETEYRETTIPQFYKSLDEFKAPFADPKGPVAAAGLQLESAEIRFGRCPYAARFEQDQDVEKFAIDYVPTTRTWSETVFFNSLNQKRPNAERQRIVDRLFDSFVQTVKNHPTGHGMDYIHVYLVAVKQ